METNTVNKPSQVMAWLGFGVSLALFILVWVINALFFSYIASPHSAHPYVTINNEMITIIGGILVILGIVFSFVVLVSAKKKGLKKLPGVLGISLCCASLISVTAPIYYAELFIKVEPLEMSFSQTKDVKIPDYDVELFITSPLGDVKCSKADGSSVTDMNAKSMSHFSGELKTWLQANGYNENVYIVIKADEDATYDSLANVLDALKELGIKKYEIGQCNSQQ